MKKNIARLTMRIARLSQVYLMELMRPFNLTAGEQPFFMAVIAEEGVTQEELTQLVGVHKAVTTRTVKGLEEKGIVVRRQDLNDRRQNRIYPTEKAKQMYQEVRDALSVFDTLLLDRLTEAEKEIMWGSLCKMEENLVKGRKESEG